MKHPSSMQQVVGIFRFFMIASTFVTMRLFADAVVDRDFDDNQNDFAFYWYYYDDNAGVGPNDRPQKAPTLKPTVINVPFTEKAREAFGDATDSWKVKTYTFQTATSLSRKCATLPFTFGDAWEATYCSPGKKCVMPYVGVGTMLTGEGAGMNLTGVDTVRFFAKSRVNDLKEVRFKIETLDIFSYANKKGSEMEGDEFGYFGSPITVKKGDWQPFAIAIADLARPGTWAKEFSFDITKCTKFAWEITGDGKISVDTLDIADVSLVGTWKFVPPWRWDKTESVKPAAGTLFSDFDQVPYNQSRPPFSYYWYAYNDAEIGGTSNVDAQYAKRNDSTGKLDINFVDATGSDGVGRGAALSFTLGTPVPKDSTFILGFVGIGSNLYDSAKVRYWNADSANLNAVYFEYFTDGEVKSLSFELSDSNDVSDMNRPGRKDKRGSGIVHYRDFPPTGGVWKKVLIPFDSLVTHDTWQGYTAIPLNKKALAKVQWKIQGAKGTGGTFAIDNVIFLKADGAGIRSDRRMSDRHGAAEMPVTYRNGNVILDLRALPAHAAGRISLVNMQGKTVMDTPLATMHAGFVTLTAGKIPAGMYFVKVGGIWQGDGTIAQQSRIMIVR